VFAAAAAIVGYFLSASLHQPESRDGEPSNLLAHSFPDLQGRTQALAQWQGKVLVVNFWATWCPPCRKEIPAFIRLQDKYHSRGLQFVGVAIDDEDKVRAFVSDFGVNYPVLIGGLDAVEAGRAAGNRMGGLPFTVILDRQGRHAGSQLGEVAESRLESLVKPLL
jgi:thiol-disulfide isomerase/thioredoxin